MNKYVILFKAKKIIQAKDTADAINKFKPKETLINIEDVYLVEEG